MLGMFSLIVKTQECGLNTGFWGLDVQYGMFLGLIAWPIGQTGLAGFKRDLCSVSQNCRHLFIFGILCTISPEVHFETALMHEMHSNKR